MVITVPDVPEAGEIEEMPGVTWKERGLPAEPPEGVTATLAVPSAESVGIANVMRVPLQEVTGMVAPLKVTNPKA